MRAVFIMLKIMKKEVHTMSSELFHDLPDIIDAKMLAETLSISKSGAYALMNEKDLPTLKIRITRFHPFRHTIPGIITGSKLRGISG